MAAQGVSVDGTLELMGPLWVLVYVLSPKAFQCLQMSCEGPEFQTSDRILSGGKSCTCQANHLGPPVKGLPLPK